MKIGIIGIGLIGGSLGLALKRTGEHTVYGYDQDHTARQIGVQCVDHVTDSIEQLAAESELIFITVPVGKVKDVLSELRSYNGIMTDVSSVKRLVLQDIEQVYGRVPPYFIPGHPIAGSEQSSARAARANLYAGHKIVLTPLADTDHAKMNIVADLWKSIGGQVEYMEVNEHDRIFALTSHLPHVLAYTLVNCLHTSKDRHKLGYYAASGFRDLTRIAGSQPELWSDICLNNRDNLTVALKSFSTALEKITQALEANDEQYLKEVFAQARKYKEKLDELK